MAVVLFDLLGVLCVGGQELEPIIMRVPVQHRQQVLNELASLSADNTAQVVGLLAQHSGVAPQQVLDALREGPRVDAQLLAYIRDQLLPSHRVGLLTNASTAMVQGVLGEHLDLFDPVIISEEVGLLKPSRGMYELAISRALTASEQGTHEVIFVDDSAVNVEGAAACGITALLYEGLPALRRDLAQLL